MRRQRTGRLRRLSGVVTAVAGLAAGSGVLNAGAATTSGLSLMCTGSGANGAAARGGTVTCVVTSAVTVAPPDIMLLGEFDIEPPFTVTACTSAQVGVAASIPNEPDGIGRFCRWTPSAGGNVVAGLLGTEVITIADTATVGAALTQSGGPSAVRGGELGPVTITGPAVTIVASASPPAATPVPTPSAPPGGATGPAPPASSAAAPSGGRSTITASLATPADAFSSLPRVLLSAAIAVLAIVLITFPAHLFNHTFEENYADIVAFWERRLPFVKRLRGRMGAGPSRARNRLIVAATILLGALLGGLLDPHFGFNGASGTTYVSMILSTLWGIGLSVTAVLIYRRLRHHDAHWQLQALPAGLFIALGCVILSRLTDFEPGYLYGVVCGAAFSGALAKHERGHEVAVATLVTVILAFAAWFLWVPVNAAAAHAGAAWPLTVVDDFLGAVFAGGLIGSTIGMLPLRFLPGGALAAWHRGAWAAITGVVVFAFVEIMLNPARGGHPGQASLVTVIVLFVVFGAGSLLFAGYFQRKRRRAAAP